MNEISNSSEQTIDRMKKNWFMYLLLGLLLVVLGVVGIVYSSIVSMIVTIWLGVLLIVAGIFELCYSFFTKQWDGFLVNLIVGLLSLIAGVFLISHTAIALSIIVMIIGLYIFLAGILRIIFAFQIRSEPIWWVVLLTGILGVVIAVMLLMHWPASALWVIGLFISIEVLLTGISMVFVSIAAKES